MPRKKPEPKIVGSPNYTACRTGVSVRWIRAKIASGELPHLKNGSHVLLVQDVFDEFLRQEARSNVKAGSR